MTPIVQEIAAAVCLIHVMDADDLYRADKTIGHSKWAREMFRRAKAEIAGFELSVSRVIPEIEQKIQWQRSGNGYVQTHDSLPPDIKDVIIQREIDGIWLPGYAIFKRRRAIEIVEDALATGKTNQFTPLVTASYDGLEFYTFDDRTLTREEVIAEGLGIVKPDGTLELQGKLTPIDAYRILAAPQPVKPEPAPISKERLAHNDYVFGLLSELSNRTEDIVTGLMDRAIVAHANKVRPDHHEYAERTMKFGGMCRKMAIKFVWILWNSERIRRKRGKPGWVPTESCVDLTTLGAAPTPEEDSPKLGEERMAVEEVRDKWATKDRRRRARRYAKCAACGKKFLAKRPNHVTCGEKCRKAKSRLIMSQIQKNPVRNKHKTQPVTAAILAGFP